MKRRNFLQAAGGAMIGAALSGRAGGDEASAPGRPNVLWITCEDISPNLGCYGDPEARTPNLDGLAAQGVRHTNAFSVSGVCAPSRSCLITGMYPTSLGTCHMRCKNPPPAQVKCFPEYLRAAGYYCTNNAKTDYNFDPPATAWDECSAKAHWRNRTAPDQPFFAVFNFTITHESKIGTPLDEIRSYRDKLPPEQRHDPAKATMPPYYPDTPVVRKHWANYYDLITLMDQEAGAILAQLEEDGLSDNTVVFFFSDHGVGLPRAKRWMYDSGLHVPFIVRWPGRIEPGTVSERLVSFVDFAPTVLSIAGAPVPDHMQGGAFLGEREASPRTYVFAARDRMDERYDIIRAARDGRFKYIRNYEPYRSYAQHLAYPEGWPVMQDMRRVQAADALDAVQLLFFRETKPLEELYDTSADPHEIRNLADAPEYGPVLERMRGALDGWMREVEDLGLVPEVELPAWLPSAERRASGKTGGSYPPIPDAKAVVFGRSINAWIEDLNGTDALARLRAIKSLGLAGPEAAPVLVASLSDGEGSVAHWGAVSLGYLGPGTPGARDALVEALDHPAVAARLGAARALCHWRDCAEALPVALDAMGHENPYVRLYAVQILEDVGPDNETVGAALEQALEDNSNYVVRVAEHAQGRPSKL